MLNFTGVFFVGFLGGFFWGGGVSLLIVVVDNLKDICLKSVKIFPNISISGRDADNSQTSKQINTWAALRTSTRCVRTKKRVTERKEGNKPAEGITCINDI